MTKKVTGLKKRILLPALAGLLAVAPSLNTGSSLPEEYKLKQTENYLEAKAKKEAFETRNFIYSFDKVPQYEESKPGNCSTFCRLYGDDNGKNYFWAGAGMRRKRDKVIGDLEKSVDPLKNIRDWYFQGKIEKADIIGVWHRPADAKKEEYDPVTKKPWPYSHVISFEGIKVDSTRYADFKSYRDSVKQGLAGELSFLHQGDAAYSTRIKEPELRGRVKNGSWRIVEGITENRQAYAEDIKSRSSNDS